MTSLSPTPTYSSPRNFASFPVSPPDFFSFPEFTESLSAPPLSPPVYIEPISAGGFRPVHFPNVGVLQYNYRLSTRLSGSTDFLASLTHPPLDHDLLVTKLELHLLSLSEDLPSPSPPTSLLDAPVQ